MSDLNKILFCHWKMRHYFLNEHISNVKSVFFAQHRKNITQGWGWACLECSVKMNCRERKKSRLFKMVKNPNYTSCQKYWHTLKTFQCSKSDNYIKFKQKHCFEVCRCVSKTAIFFFNCNKNLYYVFFSVFVF